MKTPKPLKAAHTANTQKGSGDFYGSGVKNPIGKVREIFSVKQALNKKTKPKKLA